jgi:perosamine synthetase
MLRFVPPAGFPLTTRQILRALRLSFGLRQGADQNLTSIATGLRARYVFGTSSGRAALCLVLRSLSRLKPGRNIVALPAYTCFTVAASIVRSDLKMFPVEIETQTLDFDFSQLEAVPAEKLLCIVTSNLFGLVNNLGRTWEIARNKGAFFVDDAAQALGASRNGYSSGIYGDVGIYSLGRGKALPAMEGGLVVTNSEEIAGAIQTELKQVPQASRAHSARIFVEMLAYSVLLNPSLYWIPNSLPFLKLGTTEFAPDFPISGLTAISQALLSDQLGRLENVNSIRRKNATTISNSLEGNERFSTPKPSPDSQPAYIRFPVIARDRAARDEAVSRMRGAGIGAGPFYPEAVCDIAGIGPHMATDDFHRPRAEDLARRLFTLPTHPFVGEGDLDRMIAILNES